MKPGGWTVQPGRHVVPNLRGTVANYAILLLLGALFATVAAIEPSFASGQSLLNLLQQWAPVGIMAMAGTFVMIAGGFDLSVGGTFAFAATVVAGLTNDVGVPTAYLTTLTLGAGIGLANGLIVTCAGVNPFIATIGMGQVWRGMALIYSGAAPVAVASSAFGVLGQGHVGPVPISAILLVGLFLVGGLMLSVTVFGRSVYAVGGSLEASRLSGIRINRILIGTYVISGVAAALAGIIFASRLGIGQPDVGFGIELDVIIAIVLGGTAVGGGVGAIWRTAVGVAILAVMENGFDALNVADFYQEVIKGGILVLAVAWDQIVRRRGLQHG